MRRLWLLGVLLLALSWHVRTSPTTTPCDAPVPVQPVTDCVTAEIRCGETVTGHTRGGVQKFDTKFYEKKFCTPAFDDWNGGDERIYRLVLPEGPHRAIVELDTPCADLDLFALQWDGEDCPTPKSNIPYCEAWPDEAHVDEIVELPQQERSTTWLLVVEGKDEQEGPFALHVSCHEGLE